MRFPPWLALVAFMCDLSKTPTSGRALMVNGVFVAEDETCPWGQVAVPPVTCARRVVQQRPITALPTPYPFSGAEPTDCCANAVAEQANSSTLLGIQFTNAANEDNHAAPVLR